MEKVCIKCDTAKSLESFGRRKESTDGRRGECKQCRGKNDKRLYSRYRESHKNGHLKRKFNLSLEDYNLLKIQQNNLCAICNQSETRIMFGRVTDLVVDHTHDETQQVRGLLCQKCNSGIGMFKESLELLEKAATYLREAQNGLSKRESGF